MSPEEPSNVVQFTPPKGSLRVDRESVRGECVHHHVEIRQRPRRLRCVDCKATVDPFEYVLGLAERWEKLFPKNEAARALEEALHGTIAAHGSIAIDDSGVTAKRLTAHGAKLEAHENWGVHAWHGGVAAAIVEAVRKLDFDAARWGSGDVTYPRITMEKVRGKKAWRVGILMKDGWSFLAEVGSLNQAWDAGKAEADRRGVPFIHESRPKRLWR